MQYIPGDPNFIPAGPIREPCLALVNFKAQRLVGESWEVIRLDQ